MTTTNMAALSAASTFDSKLANSFTRVFFQGLEDA
jgi:hypothetical protein